MKQVDALRFVGDAGPVGRTLFLRTLADDSQLLLDAAGRDIDAVVPYCDGWTVRDAVQHVAQVYEHKIAAVELAGPKPEPWPPQWPADRDPLDWFDDVRVRLLDTLRTVDPDAPAWTWLPTDQTAGFWIRRMAQETAVHRVDVESATGGPTPVDADLAVDGVDEVLVLMLAGDWTAFPQADLTATITVAAGANRWRVAMKRERRGAASPPPRNCHAVEQLLDAAFMRCQEEPTRTFLLPGASRSSRRSGA